MARIEQLVYTAAHIDGQHGYQVVAKSPGITDKDILDLEWYTHPAGVDGSSFKGSRSMLWLGDRIAYVMVRNIGRGYDGRYGTLYSHILVMDPEDFDLAGNDTRTLDPLYMEKKNVRGELPVIETDLVEPEVPPLSTDGDEVLEGCIAGILAGKKVAILHQPKAIQEVLALLPRTARTVPFSTVAPEPAKQPSYRMVSIPSYIHPPLPDDYVLVDPTLNKGQDIPEPVRHFATMVRENPDGAASIRRIYDRLDVPDPLDRMRAAFGAYDGPP